MLLKLTLLKASEQNHYVTSKHVLYLHIIYARVLYMSDGLLRTINTMYQACVRSEVSNSELGRVPLCCHCCAMSSWMWCSKKQKSRHNGNQQNDGTQHIRLRLKRTDWRMWVTVVHPGVQFSEDRKREENRCSKGAKSNTMVEMMYKLASLVYSFVNGNNHVFLSDIYMLLHKI